jgi:hypothetical protein
VSGQPRSTTSAVTVHTRRRRSADRAISAGRR